MNEASPGWYPDPYSPQVPALRYWDGAQWTSDAVGGAPVLAPGSKPGVTTPDGEVLAGWWQRAAALLLDQFIVGMIANVLALPFALQYFNDITERQDELLQDPNATPGDFFRLLLPTDDMWLPMVGSAIVGLVVLVVYQAGFLRWKQATPGKLAMGLRVRLRDRPGPLGWATIGLRMAGQFWTSLFAWYPLAVMATGLWPLVDDLWAAGDSRKQALHDKIARTNVVRVRR